MEFSGINPNINMTGPAVSGGSFDASSRKPEDGQKSTDCGDKSPVDSKGESLPSEPDGFEVAYRLSFIREELQDCTGLLSRIESNLYGTNSHIQNVYRHMNAGEKLASIAMGDSYGKDVSDQGKLIDNHIKGSKGDVSEGSKKSGENTRNSFHVHNTLAGAYSKIKSLKEELSGPERKETRELLERSMGFLNNAFENSIDGRQTVKDINGSMSSVKVSVKVAQSFAGELISDDFGKDVSKSGKDLNSLFQRAQWDIRSVEKYIQRAEVDFSRVGSGIRQAISMIDLADESLMNRE